MKVKYLALVVGACFSHNLWAANTAIEQRLAELEQRVINAEQRAADAESQIRSLRQQQVKPQRRRCKYNLLNPPPLRKIHPS